jgi:hypothetical protein
MPRDTCCGLSLSFLLTTAAMTVGKVHMIGPKSSTSSSMVDGVSARMRASVQVSYVFKGWSRTVITIYDDDELFIIAQGSRHTTHAKCFASLAELMKEKKIASSYETPNCHAHCRQGVASSRSWRRKCGKTCGMHYSVGAKLWRDRLGSNKRFSNILFRWSSFVSIWSAFQICAPCRREIYRLRNLACWSSFVSIWSAFQICAPCRREIYRLRNLASEFYWFLAVPIMILALCG